MKKRKRVQKLVLGMEPSNICMKHITYGIKTRVKENINLEGLPRCDSFTHINVAVSQTSPRYTMGVKYE